MNSVLRLAGERRQRISLGVRIAVLAAVCVAGAVALVSIGAYVTVYRSLYQEVDDTLAARADSLVNDPTVVESRGEAIPRYFAQIAEVRFDIIDGQGQSRLRLSEPVVRPPVGELERRTAAGWSPRSIRTDGPTDSRVLAVQYPYISGTALVIAQPLKSTKVALERLAIVLVVIGAAGILLAALAGTAVARGSVRPVLRLTRATEHVARTGDLRPIPVTGDDELARLTHSFNTMLAAVAQAQEHQRRLVADAGHELRTPLTSLRTNLELLLSAEAPGAPTLPEADRTEIHRDVRAQLDELTQLIGDLVELAREDAQTTWEPVDLGEVVEQALDRARRRAGDVQFDVQIRPWRLIGDGLALERAVLNLLDNAIKFSPIGGTVRVRLGPTDDGFAVLEVADQGPGIADEDLPRVFDRFYRSSEARTLPGSGLGLAIVKQAAVRHGGQVLAGRGPEGGALFTMWLPGTPA